VGYLLLLLLLLYGGEHCRFLLLLLEKRKVQHGRLARSGCLLDCQVDLVLQHGIHGRLILLGSRNCEVHAIDSRELQAHSAAICNPDII
jgi:hypothetical protein